MIRPVGRHALATALLLVLAGCAPLGAPPRERRVIQGPTAEAIWTARVLVATGAEPSVDEKLRWDDQMDQRISQYLARHPETANAVDVQTFRFVRQVTAGMDKEQVVLLLGPPVLSTKDAAEIEKLARQFWPLVKDGKPTETWLYPQGWRLFFNESRVVDITQFAER